jgi:Tol biopolymer transport system component
MYFTNNKTLRNGAVVLWLLLLSLSCNKSNPIGDGLVDPGKPGTPSVDEFPAWSPDGQTIVYRHLHVTSYDPVTGAYSGNRDSTGLWLVSPDGSNPRMFLRGGDTPDWSPDGKWLALGGGAQIYKIKANGDSLTQLTFEGRNFFPHWSPDGKKIAYDSNYLDARGANVIWIMDANGENKKDISIHGVGEWRMPDWSPDGAKLVYSGPSGPTKFEQIWVVNIDGSNPIQLTFIEHPTIAVSNRYPAWSPKGQEIAFDSIVQIALMNANGSNLRQLTTKGGAMPGWSPDGTRLVYSFVHLWIMNANGSNKRQLTFSPQVPQLP